MANSTAVRPRILYLLYAMVLFLAVSSLLGGWSMISDPSGESLQMRTEWLRGSPFGSYLVPGLLLTVFLGLFPLFVFLGLALRPDWPWANALNIYRNRSWPWTYSLYTGIILICWIDVQVFMIGYSHIIQSIFAFLGVAIVLVCLLPGVMRRFEIQ